MSNHANIPRTLDWAQVDVFAEAPFQGNALAIFPNAHGLSDTQMQALARETSLSETTFILPAAENSRAQMEERQHGVRVRIFTTHEELPFAGHPTLGTATWLRLHHPSFLGANEIRLHLNAGTIPVRFPSQNSGQPGLYAEMTQLDPNFGPTLNPAPLADALGLQILDLHPTLPPQVVSTGLPFALVPLASPAAAARIAVNPAALTAALAGTGAHFTYTLAPIANALPNTPSWHTRMHFYNGEDPATGSATGCAISYLVHHRAIPSDTPTLLEQGIEMQRPSRLFAHASLVNGTVRNVIVGGRTIPVAAGRFFLP